MTTTTKKTLRFGIEIETFGLTRARLAYTIGEALGCIVWSYSDAEGNWRVRADSTGPAWRVVSDPSYCDELDDWNELNNIIISPNLDRGDLELVYRIVDALALAGVHPTFTAHATGLGSI